MKYLYCNIFFCFLSFGIIYSQLPQGGSPTPYSILKNENSSIVMKDFDIQTAIEESLSEDAVRGKDPFRFAFDYVLGYSPENAGKWSKLPDGSKVWRLQLKSIGAYGVNIDFSKFQLNPGSTLFIYPPSQEYFLGGFNHLNNNESVTLSTSYIEGEEIIVELRTDPGIENYGSLQIGSLGHAYIDIFNKKDNGLSTSGKCNIDVNCPEGKDWQIIKKSVCRITIKYGSGSAYCSGVLINNVRNDQTPYLLTSNHCISTKYRANTAMFVFNYESMNCLSETSSGTYSIYGSNIISTSDSLDFTLLQLYGIPSSQFKPYYAGWSVSTDPATSAVCIHHPSADLKKICLEDDSVSDKYQYPVPYSLGWIYEEPVPRSFWHIWQWDMGTTEGGSSGAPLFDQNKHVVGNLIGGMAECRNSSHDYFSKFDRCWDFYSDPKKQLKYWLNPDGGNILYLDGFSPFGQDIKVDIPSKTPLRFTLYPNPATEMVTLEYNKPDFCGGLLKIYSLTGQKIAQHEVNDLQKASLDISTLEQGIYIIEITSGPNTVRKRLMVVNP